MQVKIKKLHENAVVPKYAKDGDAGMDIVATSMLWNLADGKCQVEYGTGIAVEIPQGYVGLIYPRSSISKTVLTLSNSVGVIDSGYRGEIKFKFNSKTAPVIADVDGKDTILCEPDVYQIGDRIGQLVIMPYPKVELVEVEELSSTERGAGGFGSSGS